VADATAFSLCMDNGMPILVFNLLDRRQYRPGGRG
jgi:uridylate kinase